MTGPDFVIRPARHSDIASLDALFGRSYPRLLKADYPPSVLVTALPLICRAQPKLVASGTFHVAEEPGGTLVGAGGWTPRPNTHLADIRHVVCDPDRLRRGIAGNILRHCFTEATAAGATLFDCKSTRTAVPFYKALGFIPLREISVPLAPGIAFPAIQMQRQVG